MEKNRAYAWGGKFQIYISRNILSWAKALDEEEVWRRGGQGKRGVDLRPEIRLGKE